MLLKAGPLMAERGCQFLPRARHARAPSILFLLTEHQDGAAPQLGLHQSTTGGKPDLIKRRVLRDLLMSVASKSKQRSGAQNEKPAVTHAPAASSGWEMGQDGKQDRPVKDVWAPEWGAATATVRAPLPLPGGESLRGSNPGGAVGTWERDCACLGHVHLLGRAVWWGGGWGCRRLSFTPAPRGTVAACRVSSKGCVCPAQEAAASD